MSRYLYNAPGGATLTDICNPAPLVNDENLVGVGKPRDVLEPEEPDWNCAEGRRKGS